jgi:hypothetical protein
VIPISRCRTTRSLTARLSPILAVTPPELFQKLQTASHAMASAIARVFSESRTPKALTLFGFVYFQGGSGKLASDGGSYGANFFFGSRGA